MIYAKAGQYFLEASDRIRREDAGFWVSTGEVTILAATVSEVELGDAVLATLSRSRVEVAVPSREAKLEAGLFRAMGVRSRRGGHGRHPRLWDRSRGAAVDVGRAVRAALDQSRLVT